MRILSSQAVTSILYNLTGTQLQDFHDALSESLVAFSQQQDQAGQSVPNIIQPLRAVMTTSQNITSVCMPVTDTESTGVKTVTVPPDGPIKGAITIFSKRGDLMGVINAAEVTAFRTALSTMLVLSISKWGRLTKVPVPSTASYNLVIFGGGKQAEWHLRLCLRFSTIRQITLIFRSKKRADEMEGSVLKELKTAHPNISHHIIVQEGNAVYDSQLREAVSTSDIICCTTPSTSPLFPGEFIQQRPKSRFISLIGSYKPDMQEVDATALLSGHDAKIVVDSSEACLEEAGELIKAGVSKEQLIEIGNLYADPDDGAHDYTYLLAPDSANVVYKCVGMSLMDLAVGKTLLSMSKTLGKGIEFDDF